MYGACDKVLYFSDCFKNQKMCDKAVEKDSRMSKFVLDNFKTQGMCEKLLKIVVSNNTCS